MARRKIDLEEMSDDLQPFTGQGLSGMIGSEQPVIAPGDEAALSASETDELYRCELIIERGLKTFFEVGAALLRVRDLRLYRVEYKTFEAYCDERWGMGRRYVNQIIAASQVRENLGAIAPKTLPENEAQARPLTRLKDPEQQREAWQQAVATAAGRITAAHVEHVVKEMLTRFDPPSEQPEPIAPATDAAPAAPAETEPAPAAASSRDTLPHIEQGEPLQPPPHGLLLHLIGNEPEDIQAVQAWLSAVLGAEFPAHMQPQQTGSGGTQQVYGVLSPEARHAAVRQQPWADLKQQLDTACTLLDHYEQPSDLAGGKAESLRHALQRCRDLLAALLPPPS